MQAIQLGEQRDAHLRQQAIGHGVRQPGFEPVQRCRHGAANSSADQQTPTAAPTRPPLSTRAPSTLTPMKASTRPMPHRMVSASCRATAE